MTFTGNPVLRETPALRHRSTRRPKHTFAARFRPFRLTPILLAPVLAGDTLKTAQVQARAITDPLVSALSGWHLEAWYFYVRIMDMEDGQSILAKLIDESAGAVAPEAAVPAVYHGYGIDWMTRAIKAIVPHYFRDYGEAWNSVMEGGLPVLGARTSSWFHNYIDQAALPADDVDATDFENLWSKWQVLSRNRMTTQTYEEWLTAQGVRPPPNLREPDADLRIPELLRYWKDWQFPVSTIEPTTGAPSNAVSWAMLDRIDKARRFAEPGFIVGFMVARPKDYLPATGPVGQVGSASGMLNTAKSWMPPVYRNEPGESLRFFDEMTGPVVQTGPGFDYALDARDVFLNGDQLVLGTTPPAAIIPRRAGADWRYPTEAGIDGLFAGSARNVVVEGVASLGIASRIANTTR